MSEYWTLGIIGLYTIVNVIVFIIQKSQIDRTKEIGASMKLFMEIFDTKKVRDFVDMNEKTMEMKYKLLLKDETKLNEIAKTIIESKSDKLAELNKEEFGIDHWELIQFCVSTLINIPKEKRQTFIDSGLPRTKRFIEPMIDDIENNKT